MILHYKINLFKYIWIYSNLCYNQFWQDYIQFAVINYKFTDFFTVKSSWINNSSGNPIKGFPICIFRQLLSQLLFKNKQKGMKVPILILRLYYWPKSIKRQLSLDISLDRNNRTEEKPESNKSKRFVDVATLVPIIRKFNYFIASSHPKTKNIN